MPIVLAGLSPVIVGLLALIVLLAAIVLISLLDKAASSDAVPGFIRAGLRAFSRAIHWAVDQLAGWLSVIALTASSIFTAPARAFRDLADSVDEAVYNFANRIRHIWYVSIPSIINTIFAQIGTLRNQLLALAYGLHTNAIEAIASTGQLLRAIIAKTDALLRILIANTARSLSLALASAVSSITSLINSVQRALLTTITSTSVALLSRILAVRTELIGLITRTGQLAVATAIGIAIPTAQRYADAVVGAYRDALNAIAGSALARVWDDIIDAVTGIATASPGTLADILIRAGVIPRVSPRGIAGTLSVVTALGAISTEWIKRCGAPLCRNLDGFGNELAALQDAAMMAEIIALIASAIRDPGDAASDIHSVLTGDLAIVGRDFTRILVDA